MLKYKAYSLIRPDENQKQHINKIIKENNGSVFHEVRLNEIVSSTFNTDLFYLVDNPEKITNFSPIHKEYLRFGLIKYNFKPLFDIPYAGFVGRAVIEKRKLNGGLFEGINYVGFPYTKLKNIESDKIGIGITAMVDLSLSEDEIFTKIIHSKRRNMIRKAVKQGIKVKFYNTTEGLMEYWPILKKLHDELGFSQPTFDYYNKIIQEYGPKKQAFILIAYKKEVPISGIFILGNKNYMHYYKGASVVNAKNEGNGELLQWEAIKLSKSLGVKQYDLCNLNKDQLPEIFRFKTGISKEIFQYQIFSSNKIGYKILNRLSKLL